MPDLGLNGGVGPQGSPVVQDSTPPGGNPPPGGSPPAPYSTPIPGVAQYSQLMALAQNYYKQTVATLNLQRGQLLQQYGYTGTIDPATGLIKNLGVDAHNPYGLYQQTLRQGGQQMEAEKANMASRGIRGGLANQGQTQLQYGFGAATNTLAQNLQSSLLGIQTSQEQAKYQEQNSIVQAQLQALNQAITMMLSGQVIDPAQISGIQLPTP